jgi:hypothetical protein
MATNPNRMPRAYLGAVREAEDHNRFAVAQLAPLLEERLISPEEYIRRIGRALHEIHAGTEALRAIKFSRAEDKSPDSSAGVTFSG